MSHLPASLLRLSGRSLPALMGLLLIASGSSHAQTAPTSPVPAKYDKNGNGRLDPDEETAMRKDEARMARVQPESTATSGDLVELTPFEVRESNHGYLATNTMSGTRLNTKLEDLGSSISVVTKQQMDDFAMLDINDIFSYEGGTEGTGNYTEYTVDRNGMVSDSIQSNPQAANRIRGIGGANISMNGFSVSGRVPIDPIDIDSVEISRGPNSSIFGLGDASGTVNLVASSATIGRKFSRAQFRADDRGGWRSSLDLNRTLVEGKLAIRASGVYQHDDFVRKPAGFDSKRFNIMMRARPFKYTTLRASYQTYRGSGTRATAITPKDGVSYWVEQGSPTWDPVTSTVTVNGVSRVMGSVNPSGLADQNRPYPVILVGQQGIDFWTIGRMPSATATNGPNNTGGVGRLLETIPEPVRDGRPLFSTLPGVQSKDIYDYSRINLAAPNYLKDASNTATIELEQYLLNTQLHKLVGQVSWQRESTDRYSRNVIGSTSATGNSYYLFVDPNSRLLDGTPNPYFKNTYVGVPEPNTNSTPYDRESFRGQLAYLLDFTQSDSRWLKWAGRHQLLGYYEERRVEKRVYRFRDVMINDNPIYAPAGQPKGNQSATGAFPASPQATRAYYHYYVGDATGNNVDYGPGEVTLGNYIFGWYNPQTGTWVYDTNTLGTSGITEGSAGSFANLNLIKTRGAMMQNYLWSDRVVLTWGRRNDESYTKLQNTAALMPDGYTFDYAAMEGWRGDWNLQSGDTKTAGVVVKPFRDWKSIDRLREQGGAKGFLATVLNGLSLFYNKSDSFIPLPPAYNIARQELGNTTSLGEDYGFAVNFGSKFAFRASHYTTDQINARNGQNASLANRMLQLDLNVYGGSARVIPLQRQATAWVSQLNPGYTTEQVKAEVLRIMQWEPGWEEFYRTHTMSETQGIQAKGDEFELTYNPSSYWTLKANATRTEAIDAGIAQSVYDWFNMRLPIWESIIDPRTGTKWLDTGYAGDLPSPGSGTPRSALLANLIVVPISLARATEGTSRPQIRKWRFNVSSSYRLSGLFDQKYLKKMTVGGSVRWESKAAIGYYGVPVDGSYEAAITLDPNRPIYDKANTYFDAFVSYSTKLYRDKIPAKFQLNVRNIQESKARLQPVGAYPNGEPHTFRIIDPRTFIFSVGFDL